MEDASNFRDRIGRIGGWIRMAGGAPAVVLILLCCFLDWSAGQDVVRNGQIRSLFLITAWLIFPCAKKALTTPIALFFSYMALMWVLKDYPNYGMLHLMCFASACFIASWLSKQNRVDLWLTLIGLGQAAFGLLEWFGWNLWQYSAPEAMYKPTGFFGQETLLGGFLAACLAPALFKRRWWAAAPIALCCYATQSSFTWAAAGSVVLLWIWSVWGWKPPLLLALAGAAGLLGLVWKHGSYTNVSILVPHGRFGFWRFAWDEYITKRPIFGAGPGFWFPQAPVFPSPELPPPGLRLTHLHSEPVEGVVEYGCVGLSIWLYGLFLLVRGWRFTWHHAAVVALLVDSLGNFTFHIPSLGVIFLTAWLLSVRERASVVQLMG